MFKLQLPSQFSPFDAIHLSRHFLHCSKQFLNLSTLMPFATSAIFCFTSFSSAQCFPLRTFFTQENKRSCSGQGQVNREGGVPGSCWFGSNCWMLSVDRKSSTMKWANTLKEASKEIHWHCTQSLSHVSWCTDTEGTLEHSPSGRSLYYKGPALQKIILGYFGSPLVRMSQAEVLTKGIGGWQEEFQHTSKSVPHVGYLSSLGPPPFPLE